MIEMHGGRIWAESIEGKGTTISFLLPVDRQKSSAGAPFFVAHVVFLFIKMVPSFVVAGRFQREYILPASGTPLLDAPGGNVLYAAAGLAVWEKGIGLLSRVSEDLPRAWLRDLETHAFDTKGIRILPGSLDMRYFAAYTDFEHVSETSPGLTFRPPADDLSESAAGLPARFRKEKSRGPAGPAYADRGRSPEGIPGRAALCIFVRWISPARASSRPRFAAGP